MQRSDFIKSVSLGIVGTSMFEESDFLGNRSKNIQRIAFQLPDNRTLSIPENQRVPFGWQAAEVNREGMTVKLLSPPYSEDFTRYFLRISIAIDIRDEKTVVATIPGISTRLGEFDIRYAPVFTPFEIPVDNSMIPLIAKNGVRLTLTKGELPLWIFRESGTTMPDVLPDTSGSAGIAAAIAIGVNSGFLPKNYKKYPTQALRGLLPYLTPDGYLGGVAQDNRGGLELQRGPYRVLAQMGMGLLAQLVANVE